MGTPSNIINATFIKPKRPRDLDDRVSCRVIRVLTLIYCCNTEKPHKADKEESFGWDCSAGKWALRTGRKGEMKEGEGKLQIEGDRLPLLAERERYRDAAVAV